VDDLIQQQQEHAEHDVMYSPEHEIIATRCGTKRKTSSWDMPDTGTDAIDDLVEKHCVSSELLIIFPRCITNIIGDMIYSCSKCFERVSDTAQDMMDVVIIGGTQCVTCGAHGHKSCVNLKWALDDPEYNGYAGFWTCRACYADAQHCQSRSLGSQSEESDGFDTDDYVGQRD
jgi:hypothetical protein